MSWQNEIRKVNIPRELAIVALSSLGVSESQLQKIYGLDRLSLQQAICDGLQRGNDIALRKLDVDDDRPDYDVAEYGLNHLKGLLAQQMDSSFEHKQFKFEWKAEENILIFQDDPDGNARYEANSTCTTRPHLLLHEDENINEFFNQLRELFLKSSRLELFILIPLPDDGSNHHWDILSSQYELPDRNSALRLLACLTILGHSHWKTGHRTEYLPKLVKSCQGLFEQVAICGIPEDDTDNLPSDPILVEQIKLFQKNVLILKPLTEDTDYVEPFAINFAQAWKNEDNCYTEWLIHNRPKEVDDMADAIKWLITNTSGVLCQISLEPRKLPAKIGRRAQPKKKINVQVVGPDPWISFLNSGDVQSRKSETFKPYKLRDDASVPLMCMSEPLRYRKLKKKKKDPQ